MAVCPADQASRGETKHAFSGRFSRIGLDIGSARIKMVQLTRDYNRICLHQYGVYPTPENCIEGGKIIDPVAVSEVLQEIRHKHLCHKNRVNLCLNSQNVILRPVTLPPLDPPDTARAMRWEAEKHLLIPVEQAVSDYTLIDKRVVDQKTVCEYVLAAVPKAIVNSYSAVLVKAGLYPEAIETAPFTLLRSLRLTGTNTFQAEPGALAIINIGAQSAELLIFAQGGYRFYRNLNLGVEKFSEETPPKLARQIAQSLEYYAYETKYPEKQCRALLLCGGGSLIAGLDTFLEQELSLRTEQYNPLASLALPASKQPVTACRAGEDGSLYVIALGLALRGWIR
ncbi:MAG: pilus assembly protein PilM [Bacillota bacterium]